MILFLQSHFTLESPLLFYVALLTCPSVARQHLIHCIYSGLIFVAIHNLGWFQLSTVHLKQPNKITIILLLFLRQSNSGTLKVSMYYVCIRFFFDNSFSFNPLSISWSIFYFWVPSSREKFCPHEMQTPCSKPHVVG